MTRSWQRRAQSSVRACRSFLFARARAYALFAALGCLLLGVNVSCGQAVSGTTPPAASSSLNQVSPRNHVSAHGYWRLVNITFTAETTYAQAQAILSAAGMGIYPMLNPPCGDLREMGAPIPVTSASSPTPV